jgi:hypothetical protein
LRITAPATDFGSLEGKQGRMQRGSAFTSAIGAFLKSIIDYAGGNTYL